ncbi:MAG: hypothetical protein AAF628_17725 [Planctomycetota bacterium]
MSQHDNDTEPTADHANGHEDELVAALVRVEDPVAALAAAGLDGCADCQRLVEELGLVTERMVQAGRDERASMAMARDPVTETTEALAIAAARGAAGLAERELPPARRGVVLGWVAAAALLILLVTLGAQRLWPGGDAVETPDRPRMMSGGTTLRAIEPRGAVADFRTFRWEGKLSAGGSYQLRIYDRDDPTQEPFEETGLETPQWTPTADERRALPRRILWEVLRVNAGGEPRGSVRQQASRS